ncbi:MAG: hypothetical protein ACOH5I_09285 [Oligoflexus sp.]
MFSQYLPLLKSLAVLIFLFTMLNAKYQANRMKPVENDGESITDEIAQLSGTVLTVLYADNKVYMQATGHNGESIWIGATEQIVQKGDQVSFELSVPRYGYYSKGLRQSFSEIYLPSQIKIDTKV